MRLVPRPAYMQRLQSFQGMQLIKIVTGVRRCGKSTLLTMFQRDLAEQGTRPDQIIAVNLEDFELRDLRDAGNLHRYITQHMLDDRQNYVFIDEVQHCADFADVLDSLYLRDNIDLYVTGSNASMLSSDIATLISGRYIEIPMLPLSFCEFLNGTGMRGNLPVAYRKYAETSSLPYALQFLDRPSSDLRIYLEGVYNTIVVKDILQRYRFADPLILESVLRFLFDSIGNRVSSTRIANTLSSAGRSVDAKTVERYLRAFMDSFLLYRVGRFM